MSGLQLFFERLKDAGFPALSGETSFAMNDIPQESLTPELYIAYDIPAGRDIALLVYVHGWASGGGLTGAIDPAAITFLHSNNIGIIGVGLRGRNTGVDFANVSGDIEEYRDAFGLEAYDEYASVKYFLENIVPEGHINTQKIIRWGISGAGFGTPVKIPDLYSLVVSWYAMAKYGTYEGDTRPTLTGWYTDDVNFQGSINNSVGGTPKGSTGYSSTNGLIDQRHMSRDHLEGVKNLLQKVYLYHDSGDTTVKVDQSDAIEDELIAQSKTYVYHRSTNGDYAHGEADLINGIYPGAGDSLDWVDDAKTLTRPTVPNTGTVTVCGFLVWDTQDVKIWCKRYKKNFTATPRAAARENQGKTFRLEVTYNLTNETFECQGVWPGVLGDQFFFVDITKGAKRVLALISPTDVVTLQPKTLAKAPRNLTSYSWNVFYDLSDSDSYILDETSDVSNLIDLTGNQNNAFQQTRASRVPVSGSAYLDNGVYILKGTSGTLSTNADGVVYTGEFTFAIKIDPDAASVASLNDLLFGRGSGGASYFALGAFAGKVQVNFDTETGSFLSNSTPANTDVGLQTIVVTRDSSNQVRVKIKNTTNTYDYGVIGTSTGDFDLRVVGAASALTKQFNGKIYKFASVGTKISDADVTEILNNW